MDFGVRPSPEVLIQNRIGELDFIVYPFDRYTLGKVVVNSLPFPLSFFTAMLPQSVSMSSLVKCNPSRLP